MIHWGCLRNQVWLRFWYCVLDESGPRLRFIGEIPLRARRLPRIRWLSNEYAIFECSLNGRQYSNCGNGLQGVWSREETPTGSQTFKVRGRDTKGNLGEPISVTIDIGKRRLVTSVNFTYRRFKINQQRTLYKVVTFFRTTNFVRIGKFTTW